jgi:hypothetical protein
MQKKFKTLCAVATLVATSFLWIGVTASPAGAHMTCANTSHAHGTTGWYATKSGSLYNTYYHWYYATNPGNSVYVGSIHCPYG